MVDTPSRQRLGGGSSHTAATQDQHRLGRDIVNAEEFVVPGHVLLRAGEHENRVVADFGLGPRWLEVPALPNADHRDPQILA